MENCAVFMGQNIQFLCVCQFFPDLFVDSVQNQPESQQAFSFRWQFLNWL